MKEVFEDAGGRTPAYNGGMRAAAGIVCGAALFGGLLEGQRTVPLPLTRPEIVTPGTFDDHDALEVDPAHHQLTLENEQVRVIRLSLRGEEAVPMHDDRDALWVCLDECHLRLSRPDGRSRDIHLQKGESRWIFADTRAERNLSPEPLEMLMIEYKSGNPN